MHRARSPIKTEGAAAVGALPLSENMMKEARKSGNISDSIELFLPFILTWRGHPQQRLLLGTCCWAHAAGHMLLGTTCCLGLARQASKTNSQTLNGSHGYIHNTTFSACLSVLGIEHRISEQTIYLQQPQSGSPRYKSSLTNIS